MRHDWCVCGSCVWLEFPYSLRTDQKISKKGAAFLQANNISHTRTSTVYLNKNKTISAKRNYLPACAITIHKFTRVVDRNKNNKKIFYHGRRNA